MSREAVIRQKESYPSSPLLRSPYQRSCLTLTAQLLMAHLEHRERNQTQGILNYEPRKGQWWSIFLLFSYISLSFLSLFLPFYLSLRVRWCIGSEEERKREKCSCWFSARCSSCRHIIHVNKWLLRSSRCSRRENRRDRAACKKQFLCESELWTGCMLIFYCMWTADHTWLLNISFKNHGH